MTSVCTWMNSSNPSEQLRDRLPCPLFPSLSLSFKILTGKDTARCNSRFESAADGPRENTAGRWEYGRPVRIRQTGENTAGRWEYGGPVRIRQTGENTAGRWEYGRPLVWIALWSRECGQMWEYIFHCPYSGWLEKRAGDNAGEKCRALQGVNRLPGTLGCGIEWARMSWQRGSQRPVIAHGLCKGRA